MTFFPKIRSNPLLYPNGRAPRLNYNHPASFMIGPSYGISVVYCSGGLVNIANGKGGIATGTPSTSLFGVIGSVATFSTSADGYSFADTTVATEATNPITAACIFQLITAPGAASRVLVCDGSNTAGFWLYYTLSGTLGVNFTGAGSTGSGTTTMTITNNIPYFLVASNANGVSCNFALTNLLTGAIKTESVSGGTGSSAALGGFSVVGNVNGGGRQIQGGVATAMISRPVRQLSIADCQRWAADPWSFWYS